MKSMKALILTLSLVTVAAACGPRQVEVMSTPSAAAEVGVRLTNNLSQAVNVYVTSGGNDIFLRQVGANATETLPVQGVASGSTVTLKATTLDGRDTYTKQNVTLSGTYSWQVP